MSNWVLGEDRENRTKVEVAVIGKRPEYRPYLRIASLVTGELLATVTDANALRGLAQPDT